jgi:serine/threonine-protein kinase
MHGQRIGHYRVLERLGAGGMGEVYLAEDTHLKRRVALKVLAPAFAADADRAHERRRKGHVEYRQLAS